MSLTKTRAWIAGTVALCLLLSVAAWFLLISPKRAEASDVRDQTVAAVQANTQARNKIAELKKQFETLPQSEAELATLRQAVPLDDELAALTRSLEGFEKDSGAALDSITAATPVPMTVAAPAAAPTPAADAKADDTAATDTAATDTGATGAAATGAAASSALVRVPVVVTVTGNYQKSLSFLKSMQTTMPRNFLVSGLAIGEPQIANEALKPVAQAEGWVTMTITGSVFALPEGAAPATAAAASSASAPATPATATDS